ncbi:MAG: hypothetical protein ACKO7U_02065 [Actinomycetota bacterium]
MRRRGQAGVEAVVVCVLLVVLVAETARAAAGAWQRAADAVHAPADARRGQALVELLALCPVLAACGCAFAIACGRVVAVTQAERELARAVRADAMGLRPAPAPGVRVRVAGARIEVRVAAPLGAVRREAVRVG